MGRVLLLRCHSVVPVPLRPSRYAQCGRVRPQRAYARNDVNRLVGTELRSGCDYLSDRAERAGESGERSIVGTSAAAASDGGGGGGSIC